LLFSERCGACSDKSAENNNERERSERQRMIWPPPFGDH